MGLIRQPSGLILEVDHDDVPMPAWWDDRRTKQILERGLGCAPIAVKLFRSPGANPDTPGRKFQWPQNHRMPDVTIIVSAGRWGNDGDWLHASISHPDRMPTYDELAVMHRAVFGDRFAYQVFAPPPLHVNQHPYCLHLWGRLGDDDGAALPNFGQYGAI